jgi:hypothetical protein
VRFTCEGSDCSLFSISRTSSIVLLSLRSLAAIDHMRVTQGTIGVVVEFVVAATAAKGA